MKEHMVRASLPPQQPTWLYTGGVQSQIIFVTVNEVKDDKMNEMTWSAGEWKIHNVGWVELGKKQWERNAKLIMLKFEYQL